MIRFFVIWLASCGVIAALVTTPLWADRAIVAVMRNCRIYIYPTAIRIALSLQRSPEQWSLEHRGLKHPTIGTLEWIGGSITLTLPDRQAWKPSWIERRILAEAVEGWLRQRREAHLDPHLPTL